MTRKLFNFLDNEIRDKIYSYDSNNSECYKVKEKAIKCGSKGRIINFSDIAIIFKGIISGDEKAHRSKPIRPI